VTGNSSDLEGKIMTASDADVVYHGYQQAAGGSVIAIENAAGETTGLVRHVVRHSPTGMGWGYAGSGPADCARSLLIAALGDAARCQMCAGTGKVTYRGGDGEEPLPAPYDPAVSPEEYEHGGRVITDCWQWDCDGGYKHLPYQDFKFEFVASWQGEWRMSRADIIAWLAAKGWASKTDLVDDESEHPEGMIGNPRPIRSAHGDWTLVGYDEKGFACLDEQCPGCKARALIINEEDAAECLTCSWREEGDPDGQ
jgi:hypothetical protein